MRPNPTQLSGIGTGRIDSLDSIRGLAALAVMLSHFYGMFVLPEATCAFFMLPVINICIDGKAAVSMFFVLSGFVLARPYLRPSPGGMFVPIELTSFYLKRVARICVPFLFVLGLSAAVRTWCFHRPATTPPLTDWFSGLWCCPVTIHDFLLQCGFLLHDVPRQLINQDWSLGIELKASILLPFYVLLARKHFALLTSLGLSFAVFIATGHCHFSFILGVLLAYFMPVILPKAQAAASRFRATLLVIGLLAYGTRLLVKLLSEKWQVPEISEKLIWTMTSLGCICILVAALSSRRLEKILNHQALTFLGRISYSVYLLHFLILLSVVPAFVHGLNTLGLQRVGVVIPVTLLFTLVVVVWISALSYEWIERPGMRLGRWLSSLKSQMGPKIPAVPAPVPLLENPRRK